MNQEDKDLDRVLSLTKEELTDIFNQMSISEVEDLIDAMNEVHEDE